ncbi:MAG: 23S rRNA (pseudouridine(1915)-N(3))-methyltransferase RlmH [Acidobacteria bacterium]|nr:MAG: 23S rRNA (pseudouridine(1915)-N(3))-methyltransferase RlmH [Acidobacteriota bacterium]
MRIRILWEGKTKDSHLRALVADYSNRIARFTDIVIEELPEARKSRSGSAKKASPVETRMLEKMARCTRVFLDPEGAEWTSKEFALWLGGQGVHGTREIAFVVGAADGLSPVFRRHAHVLLSLSRMTLTHDWARAMLLEQLYRGFTILRGFPYAR